MAALDVTDAQITDLLFQTSKISKANVTKIILDVIAKQGTAGPEQKQLLLVALGATK
jgi:hypothetical protein